MQETTNIDWKTVVALIAVMVSPIASYFIVKKQITATVLSTERKEWINALRVDVASFVANLFSLIEAHKHFQEMSGESNWLRFKEQLNSLTMLHIKIKIMLDPNDERQNRLSETIELAVNLVLESMANATTQKFSDAYNALVPLTRDVVEQELKSIKKLQ
ncbi:MAG: hypothetical protein DMF63_02475 [Acidobacteria bacterium]|nr:MAG: hypothetical protein DMF63_02475 [Acidobacteriota bacterium]